MVYLGSSRQMPRWYLETCPNCFSLKSVQGHPFLSFTAKYTLHLISVIKYCTNCPAVATAKERPRDGMVYFVFWIKMCIGY
jgi:hypothetical protein